MSIISRGKCHRQLLEKKKKKRSFSLPRTLCGSLILSDAFPASRQRTLSSPPPSHPSFSLCQALFLFDSRRIPSKNKRVSPTWFLQSRKKEPSSPPPPPPPSARRRRHAFIAIHRLHDASDIRNCAT